MQHFEHEHDTWICLKIRPQRNEPTGRFSFRQHSTRLYSPSTIHSDKVTKQNSPYTAAISNDHWITEEVDFYRYWTIRESTSVERTFFCKWRNTRPSRTCIYKSN